MTLVPARSHALDLLRGVAILGMLLSGIIPWEGLPQWMYHGQEPPAPAVQGLPRLTWIDLVFPFFLFALGAAIPLAMAKFRGRPWTAATVPLLRRGALLFALAFVNQHLRPYAMAESPSTREWLLGLLGFVLTLGAFIALPRGWKPAAVWAVRIVAWSGIVVLMSRLSYAAGGRGWAPERSDPILRVLAFASVGGSALWLATERRPPLRLAAMVAIVGLCLAAKAGETTWQHELWVWGIPHLFDLTFLGYLLIVIPGTFAGEALARLGTDSQSKGDALLALTMTATVGLVLVLLFIRNVSTLWTAPILAFVWWRSSDQRPDLSRMVRGGIGLITLGLLIEPLDGGIRKDPWTLSYVLLSPGLALFVLAALLQIRVHSKPIRVVASTGANPLLAYTAITNLWTPLWALTVGGFVAERTSGPALGLMRAAVETALFALVIAVFTRFRVTMRA